MTGIWRGGADAALAPINAYEPAVTDGTMLQNGAVATGSQILGPAPFIAINTESEIRGSNWMPDGDLPGYQFRSYQMAGTSHDSLDNLITYYEGRLFEDCKKYGCELKFSGAEGKPLDTPYAFVFQAALRNLYVWVREGVPAPRAPRVDLEPATPGDFDPLMKMAGGPKMQWQYHKDVFGNTTGGIQLANLEYPLGRYQSYSVREDGSYDPMFGTFYPFSEEILAQLYGHLEKYMILAEKNAECLIAAGWLIREDKKAYLHAIEKVAIRAGLKERG